MGTRADFWIGYGPEASWLGSVAWDGDQWLQPELAALKSEAAFRQFVQDILAGDDSATRPEQGWPWPWEDSTTTDYAYVFEQPTKVAAKQTGHVVVYKFGTRVWAKGKHLANGRKQYDWRNMRDVQQIDFGQRSGLIIL